jgi:hypothetical protein
MALDLNGVVASSASLRGTDYGNDPRKSELIAKPTVVFIPPMEKRKKSVVDHYEVREVEVPVYRTIETEDAGSWGAESAE